jgi:hypothetical protein
MKGATWQNLAFRHCAATRWLTTTDVHSHLPDDTTNSSLSNDLHFWLPGVTFTEGKQFQG